MTQSLARKLDMYFCIWWEFLTPTCLLTCHFDRFIWFAVPETFPSIQFYVRRKAVSLRFCPFSRLAGPPSLGCLKQSSSLICTRRWFDRLCRALVPCFNRRSFRTFSDLSWKRLPRKTSWLELLTGIEGDATGSSNSREVLKKKYNSKGGGGEDFKKKHNWKGGGGGGF